MAGPSVIPECVMREDLNKVLHQISVLPSLLMSLVINKNIFLNPLALAVRMRLVLISLALVGSGQCFDHMMEKMVKETQKHVLDSHCWGEGNQQKYDLAVWGAIEKCLQLAPSTELEALTSPDYKNALFPSLVKNPFKQFQVESYCLLSNSSNPFSGVPRH